MKFFAATYLALLFFICTAHAQKPELIVPIGHTLGITSMAFSPNGNYAISGSDDKMIKLWDIQTGREVRTFKGHEGNVTSVAFSPNGHYVLSGSDDKTLKLWDVWTGREVHTFKGHEGDVNSVAFSPDGRYALSGSHDKTLKLWNVQTGQEVRTFTGDFSLVISVAISPDGHYALSCFFDNEAFKLWDIRTGLEVRTFTGHKDYVNSVAFLPGGRHALSGSDEALKIWDIQTGQEVRTFSKQTKYTGSVAISPDGRFVLSSSDHTLKLLAIQTGKEIRSFTDLKYIDAVAISPDGRYTLMALNDNTLKLFDLQTGKQVRTFKRQSSTISSVDFSSNGRYALSGGGTLKLWDFRSGQGVRTYKGHEGGVNSAVFSADGNYVVSESYANHTIRRWAIQTGQEVRTLKGQRGDEISLSPDGRYALSESTTHLRKLWDTQTGTQLRTLKGNNDCFADAISPDGRYSLSTVSKYDNLELWDVQTGKQLRTFTGHSSLITSVAFSPDGRYILSGSWDRTLKIWEVQTGREVHTFKGHKGNVQSVAFSSDGRYALSGSEDNTLKLWDIQTGREVRTFTGHESWVVSEAFSPDGRYILSGAWDCTSKIWNTATGQEIATLVAIDSTDWVVTTPAGLFDASPGALKLMHYVVNDSTDHDVPWKVIELNQLKQRYYQPGLLSILMGFSKEPLRQIPAFDNVTLPPSIRLRLENEQLTIQLQNRKGGIGKVSVAINGAEVVEDLRANPQQDSTKATLTLTLPLNPFASRFDTANIIRVTAFNGAGWLSSRPQEIVFRPSVNRRGAKVEATQTSAVRDTRLRAVVVGTSNIGLRFAHKDAEQIANGLRLAATELLGKERVTVQTLTSQDKGPQQTTKAEIIKTLEAGQQSRPQDMFVLYLSGHGVNYGGQDGDFYYLTAGATSADASYLNDPAIRQTYALSSEELTRYLNLIPARKKLLILDVCAAGRGAEKMLIAARDIPASQIRALDRLQNRTGFYVLAGSAADAVSYETSVYGQGLLTYALLKGMRGASLRREGTDEFVDVEQWLGYAVEQVPVLAKEIRGIQQPFYRGIGSKEDQRSFDLGRVTEAVKAQIHIANPKPVLIVRSFQEDTQFDDVLGLQNKVEGALIDLSARGAEAPVLYMEAKDYPGAYTLNGRYRIDGELVTVNCKVFRATVVAGEFVVKGEKSKLSNLAEQILARAQQAVK